MTIKDPGKSWHFQGLQSSWFLDPLVFLLASLLLVACGRPDAIKDAISDGALTVEKETPQVETKLFSEDELRSRGKGRNNVLRPEDIDAYTEWFYSCKADLDTEDLFHDDTIGASSMALKVKHIIFNLALSITVHLPTNAPAALKKHEDGHVKICSIIYGNADSACMEAAREVVGKTFNGMGKDPASARKMALAQAQHIIAQAYHEGTSTLADQASERYDALSQHQSADPKISCQALARQACNMVLDIPAKVIQ